MKRIRKQAIYHKITQSICLFAAATSTLLCGCMGAAQQIVDAPSAAQATPVPAHAAPPPAMTRQASAKNANPAALPKAEEIRDVVARSGQSAFIPEERRFLVGDFNGDGSADLAVVVKPASGMLAKINSEYALWKLEDPRQVRVPDLSKSVQRLRLLPKQVRVIDSDLLLMVIHGNGAKGWRDPVIKGIYLLKNAAANNFVLQTLNESLTALRKTGTAALLKGDVIKQTLAGESGFIFWTGVAYAWYGVDRMKEGAPPVQARR